VNAERYPSPGDLIDGCRHLEENVDELERRNARRAERWRSMHLAGGVGVGFGAIIAAVTAWRHPDQPTGSALLASAVIAYLVLSLQPQDRAAIHTKVQDRCFSLRRDLRRFREVTVLEPEPFPGAHERVLALLKEDVVDLLYAEGDVP
jgi:pimeloyl-ACP methyl ester carboxylesterase